MMPAARESLSLTHNIGRISVPMETLDLGEDACAKSEVILQAARRILELWPQIVYSDQIDRFAREQCNNPNQE
jgi:hypothetical protein